MGVNEQAGRGSDDTYCSVAPQDGHHWVSHSVQASALRWVEICSTCQRINQGKLLEQVVAITRAEVGEATTRQLLYELRMRGDLAMTAMPTTPRGQDGSFLSASAGMLLRATERETLDARRGE